MKYLIIYNDVRVFFASHYEAGSATALGAEMYSMTCSLGQVRVALGALGIDCGVLDNVIDNLDNVIDNNESNIKTNLEPL